MTYEHRGAEDVLLRSQIEELRARVVELERQREVLRRGIEGMRG